MPHSGIYKAKANQDLNDIFTFILTQGGSADRAFNFVERIRAFCDSFANFPIVAPSVTISAPVYASQDLNGASQ